MHNRRWFYIPYRSPIFFFRKCPYYMYFNKISLKNYLIFAQKKVNFTLQLSAKIHIYSREFHSLDYLKRTGTINSVFLSVKRF